MEEPSSCISVMTWNVLAQVYLEKCVPEHLAARGAQREVRHRLVRDTIRKEMADIVCLQELDQFKHYDGVFAKMGYVRWFECRVKKREGLGMLYRPESVVLLHSVRVELDKVVQRVAMTPEQVKNHTRRSLGQVAVFRSIATGCEFVVANTHIYWSPACTDVKLFQVQTLVCEIRRVLEERECLDLPVVLCGDFNSLPRSAVVQLLETGKVDCEHPEYVKYCSRDYADINLSLPMRFDRFDHGHFTNYVAKFKGCIDYIFSHNARLVGDQQVLGTDGGSTHKASDSEDYEKTGIAGENSSNSSLFPLLPCLTWPSDHLAILARFHL